MYYRPSKLRVAFCTQYIRNVCIVICSLGYEGTYKSRAASEGFQEGEATFFKNSRFTLLNSEGYFLKDLAEKVGISSVYQLWYGNPYSRTASSEQVHVRLHLLNVNL